ncbi:MAG: hypothetical protein ACR2LH_10750 [Thermoleophilaceae bacterium]
MLQDNAPARCPFAELAEQLEAQARRPLAPRRRELHALAARFRAIGGAERAQDRRAA